MKKIIRLIAVRGRISLILLFMLICACENCLHAQTTRFVKPVVSGTGDGSSWANASNHVQDMINNSSAGDQIFVAAGTYQASSGQSYVLKEGVKVYGGFVGTETQLSQRNWVTNVTTLQGNGATVVQNYNTGITTAAVLDGFTISGGGAGGMMNYNASPTIANCIFSSNNITGFSTGGAIYNTTASPVFSNCTFSNNSATQGGAMYNASSPVTITNCTFSGNSANNGGAMYNAGTPSPTISNCTFSGNSAAGGGAIFNSGSSPSITNCGFSGNNALDYGQVGNGGGGAITNDNNAAPTITGCNFTNNSAFQWGGAIYNSQGAGTVTNCIFQTNSAKYGGGILNNTNVSATISYCKFISNTSSNSGGGMYNTFSAVKVLSCSFSGNSSLFGGGIYCTANDAAMIASCVVSGNNATNGGGGAYVQQSNGVVFSGCSFSGNKAPDGGAIYNYSGGNPSVSNSIFWGNSAAIYNDGSSPNVQYSDVEGGYAGTGNVNVDPQFLNAPSYTTAPFSTGDYHVTACSPVINAGNAALVPGGVTTDLVGNPRVVGSSTDMGAYEYAIVPTGNIIYVNKNVVTPGTGESWAKALPELADALRYAKINQASWTAGNPLKIFVAKGTYKPAFHTDNTCVIDRDDAFSMVNNVQIYGGFDPVNGISSLNDPRIFGAGGSILSGDIGSIGTNTDNCYHVIVSSGAVNTARLDGFTVRDGYAENSTGLRNIGGGLFNDASAPTLENCIFSNNYANFGGGIFNNSYAAPVVNNCTFNNNTAASYGGGVYNSGGSATYTGCTFSANNTVNGTGGGGGMFNNIATPSVTNCTFSTNTGDYGGAIYNYSTSSPTIVGCTFSSNSTGTFGGAMYSQNTASPVVTGCSFTGNHTGYGGALLSEGMTTVLNCSFSANWAYSYGGAVYNSGAYSPVYTNCVFSGNYTTSTGAGGGAVFNNASTASIVNCTFRGNTADVGAAMRNWGTASPTVRNCIIWGNSSGIYNESTASVSVQYSIVQGGWAGTGNLNVDPLFVNTTSPMGPDGIWGSADDGLRLQPCSPAVNVGNNASITPGVTTDIGGTPRIQFTTTDMGAYEANSLANASTTNLVSSNTTASGWQLPNSQTWYASNCSTLDASVTGDGTASSISGNTTAKVWIESVQPVNFVKRHYEITPDVNANTATGLVTLYFTQAEFNAFNAINTTKLPQSPSDAAGIANLRIEKRSGVSGNGSGLPASYSGAVTTIDPSDANIVWNATASRWEVSFTVTGFSGFFAKTNIFTLPLKLLSFTGEVKNCITTLQWTTTDEVSVLHFEAEESVDGIAFNTVRIVDAKNSGSENRYATSISVMSNKMYYRLKMVDRDGGISYSPVIMVSATCGNNVFVFPSPVREKLYIRNAIVGSEYIIYNNTGQRVISGRINNVVEEVTITNIASGVYYVRLTTEPGSAGSLRFVKE